MRKKKKKLQNGEIISLFIRTDAFSMKLSPLLCHETTAIYIKVLLYYNFKSIVGLSTLNICHVIPRLSRKWACPSALPPFRHRLPYQNRPPPPPHTY
jgi:hypothetical protein